MTDRQSSQAPPLGNNIRNGLILLAAIALSVLLFFSIQGHRQGPSLSELAAEAVPLDTALHNGKPTLVEFYADWCTTCQTMAPDIGQLEQTYGNDINFVMLNVDNPKWLPEVTAFEVDGIPHFIFMNDQGSIMANAVGLQPRSILAADLQALIDLQDLPFQGISGQASTFKTDAVKAEVDNDPRSHGGLPQNEAPPS